MPDFDLTGELSLKIELHMLRPITEKVHSGNGPVSLVSRWVQFLSSQEVVTTQLVIRITEKRFGIRRGLMFID